MVINCDIFCSDGMQVRSADLVTMLWYWKGQAREMALSAGMERERKREDMV